MSGKLTVAYGTPARTVYFLIWDEATGQFLIPGSLTFEAYQTANLGTYALAAAELGTASGIYQASVPAVPAGLYHAVAFDRQGGSPAEGDPIAGDGPFEWTGSGHSSLATATAESYSAVGAPPSPAQALLLILQRLTEFAIIGTSIQVKKLDGTSLAFELTLDDATNATSSTRTS
jgi:hypothetical protein